MMLQSLVKTVTRNVTKRDYKVAVLGASGGCGQAISLLLKVNPQVTHLSLYDIARTPGVAADLSHICTPAKVTGHTGPSELAASLKDSKIVIIPAGIPRVQGVGILNRDCLFDTNAGIVQTLVEQCSISCPDAMIVMISNPVNSLTPLAAEVMKRRGVHNPKRIFGLCTLDVVRANTFVAENQGFDVTKTNVTVVGGHGGTTILPLFSQVPGAKFTRDDIHKLTHSVKYGGDAVVAAKQGDGSATLSLAYAAVKFTNSLMTAMSGAKDVIECTYVENNLTEAPYFSTRCLLGPNGVEKVLPLGELSDFESSALALEIPYLIEQAQRGVNYIKNGEREKFAAEQQKMQQNQARK